MAKVIESQGNLQIDLTLVYAGTGCGTAVLSSMARINDNDLCPPDRLCLGHCCDNAATACHQEQRYRCYKQIQRPKAKDIFFHWNHPKEIYAAAIKTRI